MNVNLQEELLNFKPNESSEHAMPCRSRANEPASQKAKKTEKRNTKLKAESESFFFNLQPSVQACDKFSSFFCREKKREVGEPWSLLLAIR